MIQIDLDKLVPFEDLPGKLDQVVNDAHNGAIFVVTRDDRPAVAIVSVDQLEGLSGRKVITPGGDAPVETPPPPPSPEENTEPVVPPPAEPLPPPPPPPMSNIGSPTTSVQRDLTPGAPAPGPSPTPPPPPPDKPLDEMPL